MATCANCNVEAPYRYQINENFGVDYCQYHLPRFLYAQRNAGLLAQPVAPAPEPEPAPAPTKSKKAAPADPAPAEPAPVEVVNDTNS
jgi:hypothetical protein